MSISSLIVDSSIKSGGRHATITGATWTTDTGRGTKLVYNGTTNTVTTETTSLFGKTTDTFSICAWVKVALFDAAHRTFVSHGVVAPWDHQVFKFYATQSAGNNGFLIAAYDGTNNPTASFHDASIAVDTWYHVVAVKTTTQFLLYVDGILRNSANYTIPSDISILTPLVIGATNHSGSIDDVRIYNRDLSSTEISAIYSGATNTYGLIDWYKFDEATGTRVWDTANSDVIIEPWLNALTITSIAGFTVEPVSNTKAKLILDYA